jgi:putative SOS response-associated peptidase YedK
MPSPSKFVSGIDRGVTNIRNVSSPHWRGWLKPENRCLVPATSFCEYTDKTPKVPTWFALGDDRPLFAFAGIWCRWHGTRGTKKIPVEGEHTPDNRRQRGGEAGARQGDAGDPDDAGRDGSLDDRARPGGA